MDGFGSMADLSRVDSRIPDQLPGYFVDRFAFSARYARSPGVSAVRPPGFNVGLTMQMRERLLEMSLQPTQSLSGWIATPSDEIVLGDFYARLRERWWTYSLDRCMSESLATLPHPGVTWSELFDETVFFLGRATPRLSEMASVQNLMSK
jgi:hypothetical protein